MKPLNRRMGGLVLLACLGRCEAGSVSFADVNGPGLLNVTVTSFAERRFRTVMKQQHDFSCGSAALASLLSFHYDDRVGEADVFADMWEHGEQEKIRQQGFSMLDMKNYLARRGYQADGFRIGPEQLAGSGIPAITILNNDGYLHFVIVKGLDERGVLIGDPALGVKVIDPEVFRERWENRIMFVIRDTDGQGKHHFNDRDEWQLSPAAPLGAGVDRASLAGFNLLQPGRWDF